MPINIRETIPAPGRGPAGLAWDGHTLWNSDFKDGLIYGLDPQARKVGRTLLCHGNLSGLAWDGQFLWQSLYDEAMIRRIDPVTNDFDQHIILEERGWLSGVAWGNESLWVVAQQYGQLMSIDRVSGAVRSVFPVPVVCGDLDFHAGLIWASIATPMIFDPGSGQFIIEADGLAYAIIAIDPVDGHEIIRHPVDQFFTGLCWAENDLWLAQTGNGLLYRCQLT